MPTRNVVLTDHLAALVARLVASGRYQNASEVMREGLRLVESKEAENELRSQALREAAKIGVADIEAGRYRSFDEPGSLRDSLSAAAGEILGAGRPDESDA